MADIPGKKEVSFEPADTPGLPRLAGGSQLNMKQMLDNQNQKGVAKSQLSPETLEGLVNLKEAQSKLGDETPQPEASESAQPEPAPEPMPDSADKETPFQAAPTADPELRGFDMQMDNPFNDPKRRKIIEDRCEALNFDSLIMDREIRQTVPIQVGSFEPQFRSHTAAEERYMKRRLYEATKDGMSNSQFQAIIASYSLALSLVALNDTTLPNHLDDKGVVVATQFDAKVDWIEKLPAVVVGDLSTNSAWFEERLRNLLTETNIKNG